MTFLATTFSRRTIDVEKNVMNLEELWKILHDHIENVKKIDILPENRVKLLTPDDVTQRIVKLNSMKHFGQFLDTALDMTEEAEMEKQRQTQLMLCNKIMLTLR